MRARARAREPRREEQSCRGAERLIQTSPVSTALLPLPLLPLPLMPLPLMPLPLMPLMLPKSC